MSKHNNRERRPEQTVSAEMQPPIVDVSSSALPDLNHMFPVARGVFVHSIKIDRSDLKGQDETIESESRDGYEHYETFPVTAGEVVLRFRKSA